jgi:vacuolar-type H+-ATPase subunit I/STV1
VDSPDRVYKVTVEPEQGERGIVKRDVGMFRCPRCDTTFPRVLGRVHYLLVPETEHNRIKKELEESQTDAKSSREQIEALKKEKTAREEILSKQLRESMIASLEAEIRQLEKSVKQLKADRETLKSELN